MTRLSTFLFAEPSFTEGMARVLDIGGVLDTYNTSLTEKQADFWALFSDWRTVGQDLQIVENADCSRLLGQAELAGEDGSVGEDHVQGKPARKQN